MRTLTIEIPLKGLSLGKTNPKITANGFEGESCKQPIERIQRAMGTVLSDVPDNAHIEEDKGMEPLTEGE